MGPFVYLTATTPPIGLTTFYQEFGRETCDAHPMWVGLLSKERI